MADLAVVIADTRGGLDAIAATSRLTLIPETVREFSSLTTFSTPGLTTASHIDTDQKGWVALAEVD